ncbi:thioesterase family protein [Aciditerrimonas ferrireducens]|uniref:Thioesterase family protein n=1 Tax=Aciditerrimonas ferrireducens TaxID=667306 RepID=A0ABV6C248_9ACTN
MDRDGVAVEPGLIGRAELTVQDTDTALALGTGVVPVLATPRLVALCEQAACNAVHPLLPAGRTTVGSRLQFDHLAPVKVGSTVRAEATLLRIDGRRLAFTVSVSDAAGLVGAGRVTRVLVDLESFLAKAR